ncbi:MAG: hypothetical protein H6708_09975 [Kofleriaceae bacterium]|nr:hypothetical protein [Kofleriaceae bacterium]
MRSITRFAIALAAALALAGTGCGKKDDKGGGGGGGGGASAKQGGDVDVEALAGVTVDGWKIEVMNKGRGTVTASGDGTIDGKKVNALINVGACASTVCTKVDVAEYQKNADNLKAMMSTAMKEDPNTIFEIKGAKMGGKDVVTVYSLGFLSSNGSRVSNHGLNVFWNDGNGAVTLIISDRERHEATTFEEYKAAAEPMRATMEKAGDQLVAAYVAKL